jgi:hypothetical protein
MTPETPLTSTVIPQSYPVIRLSDEEVENPMLVIEDFFSFGHLPEIRHMLWQWYKCTVTGTFPRDLQRSERKEITHLFEHLEKLVEAAHLLNHRRLLKKWQSRDAA